MALWSGVEESFAGGVTGDREAEWDGVVESKYEVGVEGGE